jgi:hypothetical protein
MLQRGLRFAPLKRCAGPRAVRSCPSPVGRALPMSRSLKGPVLGSPASIMGRSSVTWAGWELRPFILDRNIWHFLWYGGVAGEGLRSVGEEALPSSKSVCSILPLARHLRAGVSRTSHPALSFAPPRCPKPFPNRSACVVSCVRVHQLIIPSGMGIPSPAVLAERGGAMQTSTPA